MKLHAPYLAAIREAAAKERAGREELDAAMLTAVLEPHPWVSVRAMAAEAGLSPAQVARRVRGLIEDRRAALEAKPTRTEGEEWELTVIRVRFGDGRPWAGYPRP